ncbi:hypothetical protein [Vulgatibacter sp.]|uniref:hypothetical protein n=1 Tax=Vulgatibacter sp. TaxID=1971226 RepID=UPI003561DEE1
MATIAACNTERLRQFLLDAGYTVLERELGWNECLIVGNDERFGGAGRSAEEALLYAAGALFPSAAARRLLLAALEPAPEAPVADQPPSPPQPEVVLAVTWTEEEDAPAPAPELLAEVEALRERIERQKDELALVAPQRQRLVILGWLALARACQEEAPGDLEVGAAVRELINTVLRALCDRWWPGHIAAFGRDARPSDSRRDIGVGPEPESWREVAALAAEALVMLEEADDGAGRDPAGWADAAQLVPSAAEPEVVLAQLRTAIEARGGPVLGRQPKHLERPEATQLLDWARRLRWLRGGTEPQLWAAIAGRLRFWTQNGADCAAAREALDPAFVPAKSWASLVRTAVEEERETAALAEVLRTVPAAGALEDEVVGWLRAALPLTGAHQRAIVEAAGHLRTAIASVEEVHFPGAENKLRRKRLHKLKAALAEPAPGQEPQPAAPEDEVREPEPAQPVAPEVLARTRGKRVLFVSNRSEPRLQEVLVERLELACIDWREASPRRLDAAVEAIVGGSYDVVLAATGFLDHAADGVLKRASKRVGVPYLAVEKGKPARVEELIGQFLPGAAPDAERCVRR